MARDPADGERPALLARVRALGASAGSRLEPALRAVRGLGASRVQLRAAALTYLTVVSLVPSLAVVLFFLQTFDVFRVEEEVRSFLYDNLAVGARAAIEPHLERLVASASERAGVSVGFLLLVGSAVLLLRNVEAAFDDLWGVRRRRPLVRQLPRYLGLLLAGPLGLGLSLAVTAWLRAFVELHEVPTGGLVAALIPVALSTLGFFALYLMAPPARVRARAALGGAVLAAVAWEVAKLVYAAYAAQMLRRDFIYGPLVALPLFLVWIFVSWLVTLLGARLAYAIQHPRELLLADDDREAARALELGAARIAVELAAAQRRGGRGPTSHDLATGLALPEGTVRTALGHLEEAGLVRVGRRRLALTRPAEGVTLAEVLRAVRGHVRPPETTDDPPGEALAGLLAVSDEASLAAVSSADLAALARTGEPGPPPATGAPLAKA